MFLAMPVSTAKIEGHNHSFLWFISADNLLIPFESVILTVTLMAVPCLGEEGRCDLNFLRQPLMRAELLMSGSGR
jgi:hypothetical protein